MLLHETNQRQGGTPVFTVFQERLLVILLSQPLQLSFTKESQIVLLSIYCYNQCHGTPAKLASSCYLLC